MTTDEMVSRVRSELLNRPDEDDLIVFPDDYYSALSTAERGLRAKIVGHYPELLYTTAVATTSDGGRTYDLTDDHMGSIEIWTPPGPPSGRLLSNVLPESRTFGYYHEGRKLVLNYPRVFTPGLYVRWIPAEQTPLSATQNSRLPLYCDEAICLNAAYQLASRPGFLGDAEDFRRRARVEWSGDPDDTSDMGVLGIISRQAATQGHQTAIASGDGAWWRGIQ